MRWNKDAWDEPPPFTYSQCVAVVGMIGTVVVFVVDDTTHVIARDKVAGISVQPNR